MIGLIHSISPAWRTALLCFVMTRGGRWLLLSKLGASPGTTAPDLSGALPCDQLLRIVYVALGEWGDLGCALLGELMAWVALLSVYDFCRRDMLPQTAERATWLMALFPLMALPFSPMMCAASLALLGLASAAQGRFVLGSVSLAVASFSLPSVIWTTPALCLLAARARRPDTPHWAPLVLGLTPTVSLIGLVFLSFMFAGAGEISMRSLSDSASSLRALEQLQGGVDPSLNDALWLALLGGALAAAWRFADTTPRAWPLLALPVVAWPLCHLDSGAMLATLLIAAPLYAYAAKLTEDPARERPMMLLAALASLVVAL